MIKVATYSVVTRTGSQLLARFDSHVEGLPGRALRPDTQLVDVATKTSYICDLAIAFEDQKIENLATSNMRIRHDEKVAKY